MGLIDLRGEFGRQFGGLGAALSSPSLLLEAEPAEDLVAEGAERERILHFARAFLERNGIRRGAVLRLKRSIPAHSGLGSGTQLALATARALATLYGRPTETVALCEATSRAQRSAIGTWAFEHGGFLLDGGRRIGGQALAPLLVRREMPEQWRCLVVIPDVPRGLSGEAEEEAFRSLPMPPVELLGKISRLVLMVILPALAEEDLSSFGRGITELQRLVGDVFRPVQGERFAHPRVAELVDELLSAGALGAGQSSWGPAVYGFFEGDRAAAQALESLKGRLGSTALVTSFRNTGARSWSE